MVHKTLPKLKSTQIRNDPHQHHIQVKSSQFHPSLATKDHHTIAYCEGQPSRANLQIPTRSSLDSFRSGWESQRQLSKLFAINLAFLGPSRTTHATLPLNLNILILNLTFVYGNSSWFERSIKIKFGWNFPYIL